MEYGYTFASSREDISNNTSYIKYICPKHGIKTMRISNFLNGKKCPDCANELANRRNKMKMEEVIKRINDCGGTVLNPQDYVNNTTKNLNIVCPECKQPFLTSLVNFTQHGGQVCDACLSTESIGERKIRYYLEEKNIEYEQEKWFSDCRDQKPLPFDFYLPQYNKIIEFDGSQHFHEGNHFYAKSNSYQITQKHDLIKNEYCKKNHIDILRIPYWSIEKIPKLINNFLN